MRRRSALLVIALVSLISSGCASLRPGYETPTVTVTSFRAVPNQGALPEFAIGLRVINPNASGIELRGVSYAIELEGHEVIKGVSNDVPRIGPYDSGDFTVTASVSLLAGIGLLNDLLREPKDAFTYAFNAKLDAGILSPDIRIRDTGTVSLR